MSYARWRQETFTELGAMGFKYGDITALLRRATRLHRSGEINCSIDVGEKELARLEKRDERDEAAVKKIAESNGATVTFQGDPRGCPFTIEKDGKGCAVPGRSLPARCFA